MYLFPVLISLEQDIFKKHFFNETKQNSPPEAELCSRKSLKRGKILLTPTGRFSATYMAINA